MNVLKATFTLNAISLFFASLAMAFLAFLIFPSPTSMIPAAIVSLYLAIGFQLSRPRLTVASYISEENIVFGKKAIVYISVKSNKQGIITIYDNPPATVKVEGDIVKKHLVNENSTLNMEYYVKPLTIGKHLWGNLLIVFEESSGFFKYIYEYDAPRSLNVQAPRIKVPKVETKTAITKKFATSYAPVFSHTKPYSLGDDLRRVIFKTLFTLGGLSVKVFSSEVEGRVFSRKTLKLAVFLSEKASLKTVSIAKYFVYSLFLKLHRTGKSMVLNGVEVRSFNDIEEGFKRRAYPAGKYDVVLLTPEFLQKTFEGACKLFLVIPEYPEHYEFLKQLNLPLNIGVRVPKAPMIVTIENLDGIVEKVFEELTYVKQGIF